MKRDLLPSVVPVAVSRLGIPVAWRRGLAAIALSVAWIVLCFWDTGSGMVSIWARSETFAHGFVVAPISLWLIWRMRSRLILLAPRPDWRALPLLAAAGFGWLLGQIGAVNVVTQFAFVAMLVLLVPVLLGVAVTRTILFPLAFLFFSVPFGEFLMPTLMAYTADFTVLALRVSGVPVYREGLQFVIPTGRWSVVEACSGIRYLIASIVVGTLFGYLNYSSLRKRIAFLAVSIAVPIVANWLRAYLIVMLGHLSSNRLATGVDHLVYGWLFFGFVMLVTFWIGSRYRDSENVQVASAVPAMPLSKGTANLSLAGATVGLLLVTGVWPLIDRALELPETRTVTLPSIVVPGWQAASSTFDNFTPHFQNPSAVRQQQFRKGDRQVGLYIAYYRSESAERKLVSSQNVLVTSQDPVWHAISSQTSSVAISGDTVDVNTTLLKGKSGEALVAWQWYWANDSVTASPAVAKARITWQRLTGRGDDSAAIVVYTLADRNAETLNPAELREFVGEAWPAVVNALLQTRQTQ